MSNAHKLVRLSDVVEIRTGFTFREKIKEQLSGNAYIVQIKDVRNIWEETYTCHLYSEDLPKINWVGKTNMQITSGCVLLPSRGEYYKASYFLGSRNPSDLPVIVSSQFLILYSQEQDILPEYLCWYLNQPIAQYELRKESQGSNIPMLTVNSVSQFKVLLPPIEIQQQIITLNRLWEQEQILTHKLLKNREQMMQGMFQKLLKGKK